MLLTLPSAPCVVLGCPRGFDERQERCQLVHQRASCRSPTFQVVSKNLRHVHLCLNYHLQHYSICCNTLSVVTSFFSISSLSPHSTISDHLTHQQPVAQHRRKTHSTRLYHNALDLHRMYALLHYGADNQSTSSIGIQAVVCAAHRSHQHRRILFVFSKAWSSTLAVDISTYSRHTEWPQRGRKLVKRHGTSLASRNYLDLTLARSIFLQCLKMLSRLKQYPPCSYCFLPLYCSPGGFWKSSATGRVPKKWSEITL